MFPGTMALQESHDRGLVHSASPANYPRLPRLVHEPRSAADEGLVNLYLAGEPCVGSALHREPDAVKHEPRSLLRHTECARHLARADTVLAVHGHPQCGQPFREWNRTIFEDGPDLGRKLSVAIAALPDATSFQKRGVLGLTRRAHRLPIRPAESSEHGQGYVGIGEVSDRTEQRGRDYECLVHDPN